MWWRTGKSGSYPKVTSSNVRNPRFIMAHLDKKAQRRATGVSLLCAPVPFAHRSARRLPAPLHQLHDAHGGGVAAARSEFQQAGVPAPPIGIAGCNFVEQSLQHILVRQEGSCLPAGMQIAPLAESNHFVHQGPHRPGLGLRRLNPLVPEQLRDQMAQQGPAMGFRAAQFLHLHFSSHLPAALWFPSEPRFIVANGFSVRRQSSLLRRDNPRAASFSVTSCSDFFPRLRTFIMSSSVRRVNSSTVLMPARFRQLYERTDRSSSSMVISKMRLRSSTSFSTSTSTSSVASVKPMKRGKCSVRIF